MIYVRGADSAIADALADLVTIRPVARGELMPDGERYLFCQGRIIQARIGDQDQGTIEETFWINTGSVIRECDRLIETNPNARICVMGSESAFKWSYDGAYAAAKAGLHRYVETKRLRYPGQQLVCVAPTCIVGSGMNQRRNPDGVAALVKRLNSHPKGRWLQPLEVARVIHFLLCVDDGYLTNTVVRMNGGEHCQG